MKKLFAAAACLLVCGLAQAQTTLPVAEIAGVVGAIRFDWEQFAPGLQTQQEKDRIVGISSDWSGDRVAVLGDGTIRPIVHDSVRGMPVRKASDYHGTANHLVWHR